MVKSLTRLPELSSRLPKSFSQLSPLPQSFFLRDTLQIARELIGKGLLVGTGSNRVLSRLVEVEAYLGADDPASHAYRGITPRNWPMFEVGGTCYVYLSYGINFCMNVATREAGIGHAVLLRAAEPLLGLPLIKKRRPQIKTDFDLLNGPGKLTLGLGIGPKDNGRQFFESDFKFVDLSEWTNPLPVTATPRIGINKAVEHLWRFMVPGSPFISRSKFNFKPLSS